MFQFWIQGVIVIHFKYESNKPRILRAIIAAELILVVLACYSIYLINGHNSELRSFRQACTAGVADASERMDGQAGRIIKSYLESISEEMYEYAWTTDDVDYRFGAAMTYSSAGSLDKDKMVKRTGITNGGWSRITVDNVYYYVPEGELSTEIPDSLPIADGIKGEYQKYALSLLPEFGWDESELEPLICLWNRESGWNPSAHNRSSGAHGIPQALPASKMASEGGDYYSDPEPQIRWGLKYIAGRYGSPSAAWSHFCSCGWY